MIFGVPDRVEHVCSIKVVTRHCRPLYLYRGFFLCLLPFINIATLKYHYHYGGKMYNKEIETLSREELTEIQNKNLIDMVNRIYNNVPLYRQKFDDAGVTPDDVKSIEDLHKLPFTVKQDLRDSYPFKLLTVPMNDVVRIHCSSGTTGKPTSIALTKKDIDIWAEIAARSLSCAGLEQDGLLQVAYGYGLFTGGFGVHYGAEQIGATVLPMSIGNTAKQLMLMQDFGSTHLACTPSYAHTMAEALEKQGKTGKDIPIKAGIFGAEPWSEELRHMIEEKLDIKAYDIYGLSEIMGPGVAMECSMQDGLHIWEDHFIAEIIDPDTLEVLPDGTEGELVITTITKEGMPILRYRTRDISMIYTEQCACGRTHRKIKRIKARTDDMLIIRGVNVFPSQIEGVLLDVEGVQPHYSIIVTREGTLDNLEIQVELSDKFKLDTIADLENLTKTLRQKLQSVLGIASTIKILEPNSLQRFEGKSQRVIDKRKEQ